MLEQGYDVHGVTIADDVTVTTKGTVVADSGTRAVIGADSVVAGAPAGPIEHFDATAEDGAS